MSKESYLERAYKCLPEHEKQLFITNVGKELNCSPATVYRKIQAVELLSPIESAAISKIILACIESAIIQLNEVIKSELELHISKHLKKV